MSKDHHTSEPWFLPADGDIGMIYGSNAKRICRAIDQPSKENIRRIVACVNACQGISTYELESGLKFKMNLGNYLQELKDYAKEVKNG
jgi:hypothetical protein